MHPPGEHSQSLAGILSLICTGTRQIRLTREPCRARPARWRPSLRRAWTSLGAGARTPGATCRGCPGRERRQRKRRAAGRVVVRQRGSDATRVDRGTLEKTNLIRLPRGKPDRVSSDDSAETWTLGSRRGTILFCNCCSNEKFPPTWF